MEAAKLKHIFQIKKHLRQIVSMVLMRFHVSLRQFLHLQQCLIAQ